MQQRHDWPKQNQAPGQVTECPSTAMLISLDIDYPHLFHHLIMRQIGGDLGYRRVMQREKRKLAGRIEPIQNLDPAGADSAMSVVDHHIGVRMLSRAG